ncbi:MAG: PAS domain S-box protein [Bacteroidota bacterium]
MEDQQRLYEELLAENQNLRSMLDIFTKTGHVTSFSDQQYSDQAIVSNPLKHELINYALDLGYIPFHELYPFILSRVIDIFSVKSAAISIYNDESSELLVKYNSLTAADNRLFSKLTGKHMTDLRIPVSKNQYKHISLEPFRMYDSLYDLFSGAVPEIAGKKIESKLNLGWFVSLGFIFNRKLIGTLMILGPKGQEPLRKEDLAFFYGITVNALGRIVAEESLNRRKAGVRQLFDETPVGFQSLDSEGCFIDVNQAWLNILGYQRNEVIGKWIGGFMTENSKSVFFKKNTNHKVQEKTNCMLEMVHKDGRILLVESEGKIGYDKNGNLMQSHFIFKDSTAQHKAEERVKERDELIEAIADYTASWESWFDKSGKIIWTNPASLRLTGYTPEEIIALPDYISILVAEEDRDKVSTVLHEALQGKDRSGVEFTCIRKDKSTFRMNVTWNHICDKKGKPMGIRTSGQDINSLRQAEEAVSNSETLYRKMIDNAPFGMHFYQIDDKDRLIFISANPAADKILGIDHSQFIGLTIEEAFPSLADTDVVNHYYEAAIYNKTWVTDQIVYSDNRVSGAFEVKAFQTVPGKLVTIFTDITKRKLAEEALRSSQQLFEVLARVSPVGIFRTDANGETTFVNPKWTALTGLSFNDALESKYLTAIHPDDKDERVAEWHEAVKEGKTVVSEYRFLRPDGSIVWVQGHAVPEIANDKIMGYIGTITDISELKKAEEELLKAKEKAEASNRLKTTFMGNISHEIRTPLNGIIGFAELISSGSNTSEENEECIEFLNHSINRLTKIIDNIMDVSMMMSGNTTIKNETFSIDELVNEIYFKYELQAARKNLNFSVTDSGKKTRKAIRSDKSLINRIICELVDNAIKFTNRGSVIISYRIENNIFSFCVSDSGVGISHEFLPFIFEPFVQEDVYSARVNNSNGLGLSIVHESVSLLGGKVTAESNPGSGTSITVTLPVIESDKEIPSGFQTQSGEKPARIPVILIVEDEEINMIYLKRLLSQKGYKLLLATNAPDAISYIEQGSSIDLVLMDMKMPGMDGFEATRRIKELSSDIRIAAVTAYASDTDRNSCFEAGCDDYIAKPFQKNDLYQLLDRMIF